jgi:hypothetical protein
VPRSPEEEAELDALRRVLARGGSDRGGLPTLAFHALSFWVMKRRAGEVGERLGREHLAPLWRWFARTPRLHLIGHSFGAKLVTAIALGGARADSVTPCSPRAGRAKADAGFGAARARPGLTGGISRGTCTTVVASPFEVLGLFKFGRREHVDQLVHGPPFYESIASSHL